NERQRTCEDNSSTLEFRGTIKSHKPLQHQWRPSIWLPTHAGGLWGACLAVDPRLGVLHLCRMGNYQPSNLILHGGMGYVLDGTVRSGRVSCSFAKYSAGGLCDLDDR